MHGHTYIKVYVFCNSWYIASKKCTENMGFVFHKLRLNRYTCHGQFQKFSADGSDVYATEISVFTLH